MTAIFSLGQEVQLKSGGPIMVVDDLADYGSLGIPSGRQQAKCTWFDDKRQRQTDIFELHSLKAYEPPKARRMTTARVMF